MKKYIYAGLFAAALISVIAVQHRQIEAVKEDRDTYKRNTHTLLGDVERYRTKDSLQAVSVSGLCLTFDEYENDRQEDMKLIKQLKADKSRLQQIITAQTETDYYLSGTVDESIFYRQKGDGYVADTLQCIDINEKWFDMHGCIDKNSKFTGKFESRDSLLYVEHVVPKRFLFIKWGVKERRQEIVSRNPHTRIAGAEFVTLRK